jgi:hypothetical protein
MEVESESLGAIPVVVDGIEVWVVFRVEEGILFVESAARDVVGDNVEVDLGTLSGREIREGNTAPQSLI